jgi:tetratricopeptide (TPR) repeat protein
VALASLALLGCAELQGRRHARQGNRFYLEGNYAKAVEEYARAEQLLPNLSVIALNHGIACRQMMVPGAKTAENEAAASCALEAFSKLKRMRPQDPRGEQLYLQTLFDADRFDALIEHYEAQLRRRPENLEAVNALAQICARLDRWDEALKWTRRRSEIALRDPEAQYATGVLIWTRLFQKGGHGEQATYNPKAALAQPAPPFAQGDIVGSERALLADLGIQYLERALALRPTYREAMVYLNLLYRQKSYAFLDEPERWQAALDQALLWQKKAQEQGATFPPAQNGVPN